MKCEICGKEIIGQPYKVSVDGANLLVCKSCARFGKPVREQGLTKAKSKTTKQAPSAVRARIYTRKETHHEKELVPNYNRLIIERRKALGWTTEHLARILKEKESWIKKIESGKIVPPLYLAKKLERVLGITLLTDVLEIPPDELEPSKKDLTIGDLIEFKEKKKNKRK